MGGERTDWAGIGTFVILDGSVTGGIIFGLPKYCRQSLQLAPMERRRLPTEKLQHATPTFHLKRELDYELQSIMLLHQTSFRCRQEL